MACMKRQTFFLLTVFLLAIFLPNRSEGQFFKRLFGRKHHKNAAPIKSSKPVVKKPAAPPYKSHAEQLDYPKSEKKDRYRIDLLAQLYLNELVKNNKPAYKDKIPEKYMA